MLGELIAKDKNSYKYLVESIQVHPDQEEISSMMKNAGFRKIKYTNLSFGIAAVHVGYKI